MSLRARVLSRGSSSESPSVSLEGVTENIGGGGVAVLGDRLLPVSSVLRCEFVMVKGGAAVPTLAEVRWSSQVPGKRLFRLGLQFLL